MTPLPDTSTVTVRAAYQPVMGTRLDVHITAADDAEARRAQAATITEARRLEARLTAFDAASDLSRWRSGALDEPGPDLGPVLERATWWRWRSAGAFNPASGVLTARWLSAEERGVAPTREEMADLAATIASVPSERAALDIHAVAKGHVVDRIVAQALATAEIDRIVVNAGGDLIHRGSGSARVGVEDPLAPYDNRPPLLRIEVSDEAVATSGRTRRWFRIGDERFSRVLDPRTGWPVEHTASATVVAPDAATADVLATITSVLEPAEAVAFVHSVAADPVDPIAAACLIVELDGTQHRSSGWSGRER